MSLPAYPTPGDVWDPWPITADDVLAVMGIPAPTAADRVWLEHCVAAVARFVGRYAAINALAAETAGTAALQWSMRLYQRRGSASGLQSFDMSGMAYYVSREDPDIAQALRVKLPRIG